MVLMRPRQQLYQISMARLLLLVLLLQLFSPLLHAFTTEPEPDGFFTVLCTMQGYQIVWVETEATTESEPLKAPIECPYCLFNLTASGDDDTAISAEVTLIEPLDLLYRASVPVEQGHYYNALLKSLPIRAPPLSI